VKGQSDHEIAGTPRNIFKYDSLVYINAGTALITILVDFVNRLIGGL